MLWDEKLEKPAILGCQCSFFGTLEFSLRTDVTICVLLSIMCWHGEITNHEFANLLWSVRHSYAFRYPSMPAGRVNHCLSLNAGLVRSWLTSQRSRTRYRWYSWKISPMPCCDILATLYLRNINVVCFRLDVWIRSGKFWCVHISWLQY